MYFSSIKSGDALSPLAADCNETRLNKPAAMGGLAKFSRRQWLTLVGIGSVYFASAICISLQAPFYPQEAERKGATATEYGLVFGVFELVAFLCCPIFGKYINVVGAKTMLNVGIFVAAISCMLFGLLDFVHEHAAFIGLSFALRIGESLGTSSSVVAAFSIIAAVFPDTVATTFIGGYILPFMLLGGVLLLDSAFIFLVLPKVNWESTNADTQGNLWSILKVPSVVLDTFCTTAAAISMGFYSATLEPHLRQVGLNPSGNQVRWRLIRAKPNKLGTWFGHLAHCLFKLTPVITGVVFVLSGAMYTVTAPLVGRLCDTKVYPKKFISFGSLCIIASYILVGPAPGIPLETSHGFPDNISTYGLVSGLWMSSFSLGAFIGPSVGGLLYDLVEFKMGTLFVIVIHILVTRVPWVMLVGVGKMSARVSRQRAEYSWEFVTDGSENMKCGAAQAVERVVSEVFASVEKGCKGLTVRHNKLSGKRLGLNERERENDKQIECVLAFCFVCLEKRPSNTVNQERSAAEEGKAMLQSDNKVLGPESKPKILITTISNNNEIFEKMSPSNDMKFVQLEISQKENKETSKVIIEGSEKEPMINVVAGDILDD
uniref:(California timema) hypothetical protein n=1 Tax=Timema californicum TaxID=61474 RepID=A0A7R9P4P8_TIMCA|nr:unnamed protein product [Timema californicum]